MMRERYWLSVISSGRPRAVEPMTELIGEATWYVGADDEYDAPSVVRAGGRSRRGTGRWRTPSRGVSTACR